jgi:hypothetical protein
VSGSPSSLPPSLPTLPLGLLLLFADGYSRCLYSFASYAALGLVHTLNPLASGGAEHDPTTKVPTLPNHALTGEPSGSPSHSPSLHAGPSAASTSSSIASIPKGYGRIIRDSEGNVVRVELSDDEENAVKSADVRELPGLDDPEMDKEVMTNWVTELGGGRGTGAAIVHCEFQCLCVPFHFHFTLMLFCFENSLSFRSCSFLLACASFPLFSNS